MKAKSERPNPRRLLANRGLVIAVIATLITIAVTFLARDDRVLHINYESDQSRFEVNSAPPVSPAMSSEVSRESSLVVPHN